MAFESTISAVDRFVGFGQVEAKEKSYLTFQRKKLCLTVNTSGPWHIRFFGKHIIWKTCQRIVPLVEVSFKSVVGGASITDIDDCLIVGWGI